MVGRSPGRHPDSRDLVWRILQLCFHGSAVIRAVCVGEDTIFQDLHIRSYEDMVDSRGSIFIGTVVVECSVGYITDLRYIVGIAQLPS